MNDFRESRKKDIMDILMSNPNQAILMLKLLVQKDLHATLESIFEKHIVPRFGLTVTDSLVYEMMELAHNEWRKDFDIEIEKLAEENKDER